MHADVKNKRRGRRSGGGWIRESAFSGLLLVPCGEGKIICLHLVFGCELVLCVGRAAGGK